MAKAEIKKDQTVKAIVFFREEGAYGFKEYELQESLLDRYSEKPKIIQADVFAICASNLTKKAREIFGI